MRKAKQQEWEGERKDAAGDATSPFAMGRKEGKELQQQQHHHYTPLAKVGRGGEGKGNGRGAAPPWMGTEE